MARVARSTSAPLVTIVAALALCGAMGCAPRYRPGLPPPGPRVVELALGADHSCALREDGSVWCWGDNSYGQRGLGNGKMPRRATPALVQGAVQIAAGDRYTCALLKDRTVSCWGENWDAQIGRDRSTPVLAPTPVPGLSGVVQLAAGAVRLCALLSSGEVVCRGLISQGESQGAAPTVETLTDLGHPRAIAGGGHYFCALQPTSQIQCWGYSHFKDRLDGGVRFLGSAVTQIAVRLTRGCALMAGGSVWCWDATVKGRVGERGDRKITPPYPIQGLPPATALTVGSVHACALLVDAKVRCWGANYADQLGNGSVQHTNTALPVGGLEGIQKVAAGHVHTCALRDDGVVFCWGNDERFQVGADPALDNWRYGRAHLAPRAVMW